MIDAVYTWVDSARPEFSDQLAAAVDAHQRETGQVPPARALAPNRFADLGCLRHSLRSLWRYAPWIRQVHLVTAGECPKWLDLGHGFVRLVRHEDIFPGPAKLPTFNSFAIEACLHRIEGVSDRFIYFNDDVFLTKEVAVEHFIEADGSPKLVFESWPMCSDLSEPGPVGASAAYCWWLLDLRFGHRPVRLEVVHEPLLFDRGVLEAIEREWPRQMARTRGNRFRTRRDFTVVRMYRHYCLELARQRASQTGASIDIRPSRVSFVRFGAVRDLAARLAEVELADRPFLCVNDETGEEAPVNEDHTRRDTAILTDFFDRRFPEPAPWEITA